MQSPSTRQRVGLGIAGVLNAGGVTSMMGPTPDGDEVGPPFVVLVLSTAVAVVGLLALVPAWRGNAVAMRVVAASLIVASLLALPAFFVGVPAAIKLLTAVFMVISILALALMFSAGRHQVTANQEVRA